MWGGRLLYPNYIKIKLVSNKSVQISNSKTNNETQLI
jgi:hypothetical protein